mmetsp:Transcript_92380/g.199764  ORF Transcript_92380/g.199764 Transcript_92380/m.199764 type:complete len:96 (-) Transcript_92380:609-896(-)
MVHPQKRTTVEFVLETVMSRMVEVYKLVTKNFSDLLTNSPDNVTKKPKQCEFLIYNIIMSELKKTPEDLEIKAPRYFREMKQSEERTNLLDSCYM